MSTIYDVAKKANVSIKTVSRVLNEENTVHIFTKRKVVAAIKQLNYSPSIAARSIRSKKTGLIGVITSAITSTPISPGLAGLPEIHLLRGIQSELESSGKQMLIADTEGKIDNINKIAKTFKEHRVEGILYVSDYNQSVITPKIFNEIPSILVNGFDQKEKIQSVTPDDEYGGYISARTAFKYGHTKVGYLTLDQKLIACDLRKKGFIRAHKEIGLEIDDNLIISAHVMGKNLNIQKKMVKNGLEKLLLNKKKPTVICCGNDRMAMQLYNSINQKGLNIPKDISVIGYDNYVMISEMLNPVLTTIELPYEKIGRKGANMLMNIIKNKASLKDINKKIVGKLILRKSLNKL